MGKMLSFVSCFTTQLFFQVNETVHPRTPPATCHSGDNSNPHQLPAKLSLGGRTQSGSKNLTLTAQRLHPTQQ